MGRAKTFSMIQNAGSFCMIAFFLMITFYSQAQRPKIVAECTITFSITMEGTEKSGNAVKTVYIKGRKTRSEIESKTFHQTTIYDNKTGEAVILKEVGGDKYMTVLDAEKWKEKNNRWDGSTVQVTNEAKNIVGYSCRKAIVTTKDGKNFIVYFTTEITPSATENPYQFKNIPGLILEYESLTQEGKNIRFTATNINLSPVPAIKFTIPVAGYRII